MQEQTRVIKKDVQKVIQEGVNSGDFLLELQEKPLRNAAQKGLDGMDLLVEGRMETIIRDCIIAERLHLGFGKYMENLIACLADLFEEA